MEKKELFFTLNGYQRKEEPELSPSMEDYLEMIYRSFSTKEKVRVCDLSELLHVKPSSTSKMVHHLSKAGYLNAERYGQITLTDKGRKRGRYLLYRHNVVLCFLSFLTGEADELEEAEKIEHFLSEKTIACMALFLEEKGVTWIKNE